MRNLSVKLAGAIALLALSSVASAMPEHDGMMKHKMTAKEMNQLKSCKAMMPAKANRNARCMKLMKAEKASMDHDKMGEDAMSGHKM